jgi:hypothetical protein
MAIWGLTPSFVLYTDTVVDQTTKLEWQLNVPTTTYTKAGAESYCAGLTPFGQGVGRWRLPTKAELLSIVEWGNSNPALYNPAFGNSTTLSTDFWTYTPYVDFTETRYNMVNFHSGLVFNHRGTDLGSVRCVRDSELNRLRAPDYTVSGDMIVDNVTGRRWQKDMEDVAASFFQNATANYCAGKSFGGISSGWRLPTVRELLSVVRPGFGNGYNSTDFGVPAIALTDGIITWTSTPVAGNSAGYWASYWDRPYPTNQFGSYHMRCVHD